MLKNDYEMRGKTSAIYVTRKKDGKRYEVIIDTADLPSVLSCRSVYIAEVGKDRHGNGRFYAVVYDSNGRQKYLHRYLTKAPEELVVDHLDGNPLNNTRENLKITTQAMNTQNRRPHGKVGIRGVSYWAGAYHAQVILKGKRYYLGRFKTAEEAAAVAADFRAKYMPNSKEGREARCKSPLQTEIIAVS